MPKLTAHPSREDLSAYSLGQLPEETAVAIDSHISDCEPCCETIVELSSEDTFAGLLQEVGRLPTDRTVSHAGAPSKTSYSDDIPSPLTEHPRYEVLELIGKGGMGDVYKARHRKMERTVALKVINRGLFQKTEAIDRFHREVKAAAQLSHPNIVTAYDADQAGDFHFMVMEYVDGIDLSQTVKIKGALQVADACDYIRQAAIGLQHAHECGMVHRDIKPHNLMVTSDGTVKILDFGLASLAPKAIADADTVEARGDLTAAGAIMGTPDFISPEQAEDARKADIRSDIYSLGATLYYLLSACVPFDDGSVMHKLKSHAQVEPAPLSSMRDDAPDKLVAIASKMMAKDPDERYLTPKEVAEALESFLSTWQPGEENTPRKNASNGGNNFPPDGQKHLADDSNPSRLPMAAKFLLYTSLLPVGLCVVNEFVPLGLFSSETDWFWYSILMSLGLSTIGGIMLGVHKALVINRDDQRKNTMTTDNYLLMIICLAVSAFILLTYLSDSNGRIEITPQSDEMTLGTHPLTIVDTSGVKPLGGTSSTHQDDASGITTHVFISANGRYNITLVDKVLTVNGEKYTLENPNDAIRIMDDRIEITRVAEQGTKKVAPADRVETAEATLTSDGATATGDPGTSPNGKPVSECAAIQAALRKYYTDKYPLFAAWVNQNSSILSDPSKLREREWMRQINELGTNSPVSEVINSFPGKPYVTFTEVSQASRNEVLVVCVNLYRNADETCRVEVTKKQRKKRAGDPVAVGKPITEEEVRKLVRSVAKDSDFKQLQGDWDVIAFTQNGKKEFAADKGVGMLVQIKGDTITRIQTAPNGKKSEKEWGRIELNSRTNPKSIEIVNPDGPGGRLLGIYELKDGTLKICFAEQSNIDVDQGRPVKRPTTFAAPAGSERVLIECGRPESSNDFEREAAKWVLGHGGLVVVKNTAGRFEKVENIDDLPARQFAITHIGFQDAEDLSDESLKRLEGLHLRTLTLTGTQVTDAGLAFLQRVPQLDYLVLNQCPQVSLSGVSGLRHVKALSLRGTPAVSDRALESLKEMPNLSQLDIGGNRQLTDQALTHIAKLKQLKLLALDSTSISDVGLKHLAPLQELYTLNLASTATTDAGLKRLSALDSLFDLNLASTAISDDGLTHLATLDLYALNLDSTAISDAGLKHLAAHEGLRRLSLNGTGVTAQGVAELREALSDECQIDWELRADDAAKQDSLKAEDETFLMRFNRGVGGTTSAESANKRPAILSGQQQIHAEGEDNAALVYWQAFALLPELSGEDTKLLTDLEKASELGDDATSLLKRSNTAVSMINRLQPDTPCRWEVIEDGPSTLLPHLSKAWTLARLLVLQARVDAESGKTEAAVDHLTQAFLVARNVDEGVLVQMVVGDAIESLAADVALSLLRKLDASSRDRFAEALSKLPKRTTFTQAMRHERDVFGRGAGKMMSDALEQLGKGEDSPAVRAILAGTEKRQAKWLEELLAEYDKAIEASKLPHAEANKELERLEAEVQDLSNPLIQLMMPSLVGTNQRHAKVDARIAEIETRLRDAEISAGNATPND